jgi:hypothetical protein
MLLSLNSAHAVTVSDLSIYFNCFAWLVGQRQIKDPIGAGTVYPSEAPEGIFVLVRFVLLDL